MTPSVMLTSAASLPASPLSVSMLSGQGKKGGRWKGDGDAPTRCRSHTPVGLVAALLGAALHAGTHLADAAAEAGDVVCRRAGRRGDARGPARPAAVGHVVEDLGDCRLVEDASGRYRSGDEREEGARLGLHFCVAAVCVVSWSVERAVKVGWTAPRVTYILSGRVPAVERESWKNDGRVHLMEDWRELQQ
ncbi:hypothetical protein VFPBJ_00313 [Purpureocillium lilacinum]|uniref:Uncharacterized protein n=1 Tax=Purpureocillium lilacinum TaxID=33203 RepID=A0A179H9T9_PURLI|nr:hypothetical protein VFPBJ_00313 [Purpureocillium lilacinum]